MPLTLNEGAIEEQIRLRRLHNQSPSLFDMTEGPRPEHFGRREDVVIRHQPDLLQHPDFAVGPDVHAVPRTNVSAKVAQTAPSGHRLRRVGAPRRAGARGMHDVLQDGCRWASQHQRRQASQLGAGSGYKLLQHGAYALLLLLPLLSQCLLMLLPLLYLLP